jgi:CDP-diacylglycerol--serine O-phosphatidyltransferase
VSFGAAPAFLLFQVHLYALGGFGVLLSSFLMVFAGLRLARFNTQLVGFEKDHFTGLPTPASALTVAAFVQTAWSPLTGLHPLAAVAAPWIPPVLGALMVSKVRYDTLPKISRRSVRKEPWKFIFLLLAIIVVVITGGGAILPLLALFILLGVFRTLAGTVRHLVHGGKKLGDHPAEPSNAEL